MTPIDEIKIPDGKPVTAAELYDEHLRRAQRQEADELRRRILAAAE